MQSRLDSEGSIFCLRRTWFCDAPVKTSIILQFLHLLRLLRPASIMMFLLLSLSLAVAVNCLDISVSTTTSSPSSAFHTPPSGWLTVEEGKPFYVRCVSSDHFSSNSSLTWNVQTKAWESSLWMNATEMGLEEKSVYSEDLFTSILYVRTAGAKDVGRYRWASHHNLPIVLYCCLGNNNSSCVKFINDQLDIDGSEEEESLYIYVATGGVLTPHDPGQTVMVTLSGQTDLQLPCTPCHPNITVSLTSNGEDVTDQFQFDPRLGFSAPAGAALSSSSFTCYFSLGEARESLSVKIINTQTERPGQRERPEVTVSHKVSPGSLQLVCKVFTHQHSNIDIYWTLPSLQEQHQDDLMMMMMDRFSQEEVKLDNVIVSTLVIEELDHEDQGVYKCRAETMDGQSSEAETFVNVEVEDFPSELITPNPDVGGQREVNRRNSGTTPRLHSVFIFICGLYHKLS